MISDIIMRGYFYNFIKMKISYIGFAPSSPQNHPDEDLTVQFRSNFAPFAGLGAVLKYTFDML